MTILKPNASNDSGNGFGTDVIKAGNLYIPDGDGFFARCFDRTGERFDYQSLLAFMRHVPEDRRNMAYDVGAHVGSWTVHLCKWFKSVHAFEPDPVNYSALDMNVEGMHALLVQAALGEAHRSVGLSHGKDNSGQVHIASQQDNIHCVAPMLTIDQLNPEYLDALKIDAEGYEYHVLRGGMETIERTKPTILIEENGLSERYGIKSGDCLALLKPFGYREVERVNKDIILTSV